MSHIVSFLSELQLLQGDRSDVKPATKKKVKWDLENSDAASVVNLSCTFFSSLSAQLPSHSTTKTHSYDTHSQPPTVCIIQQASNYI